MMKWCVLGFEYQQSRYQFLSDWLNEQGIENSLDILQISAAEFPGKLAEVKNQYDQIRIEKPFRNEIFRQTKKNTATMILLRTADCFFKDSSGEWWLRSPMTEGIGKIISSLKNSLQLDGSALIVGSGGAARAAIAALVKAGYQTFNITNSFDDQATDLIAELRKIYFNIKFNFVSQGQLVLLPGANSIMVNATPQVDSNDLLDELQYFNFLVSHGLVWDFTLQPVETPLIKEAVEVGAKVFRGYEFAVAADMVWLHWIFPEQKFSEDSYREGLVKVLA